MKCVKFSTLLLGFSSALEIEDPEGISPLPLLRSVIQAATVGDAGDDTATNPTYSPTASDAATYSPTASSAASNPTYSPTASPKSGKAAVSDSKSDKAALPVFTVLGAKTSKRAKSDKAVFLAVTEEALLGTNTSKKVKSGKVAVPGVAVLEGR